MGFVFIALLVVGLIDVTDCGFVCVIYDGLCRYFVAFRLCYLV